MNYH